MMGLAEARTLNTIERGLIGTPEAFRARLERLGPIFMKLGQFLALRPDLIPAEYGAALLGLLDDTHPMPWDEARALLAEGLGQDPDRLFAHVRPRPVGSGSIAQAHRASLHDGREVVVKIRRRGIAERVERDLRHAARLAAVLERAGVRLIVSPREAVEEMALWLRQELDFKRELDNLTRMYANHADDDGIRIPEPYPELSGEGVLTCEFLDGIALSRIIRAEQSGDAQRTASLRELGYERERLAYRLLDTCLTQIFVHRFFAVDLHPGNLMLLPDGRLGMIDFGLCGDLEATMRQRLLRYFGAIVRDDSDALYQAAEALLESTDASRPDVFKREFYAATSVWTAKRRAPAAGEDGSGGGETHIWLMQIVRAARSAHMRVSNDSLALYRALLTAETVTGMLGARTDLRQVGADFFPALQMRELLKPLSPQELQGIAGSLVELLKRAPERLEHLLSELFAERYTFNVETRASARDQHLNDRHVRMISVAIVSVGLSVLLGSASLPVWVGVPVAWPVGIALGGCYLWLLKQWLGSR